MEHTINDVIKDLYIDNQHTNNQIINDEQILSLVGDESLTEDVLSTKEETDINIMESVDTEICENTQEGTSKIEDKQLLSNNETVINEQPFNEQPLNQAQIIFNNNIKVKKEKINNNVPKYNIILSENDVDDEDCSYSCAIF